MKFKNIILLGAFGFALAGCTTSIESFARNAARHACTNIEECDKAFFEEYFNGDRGRCKDEIEADYLAMGREAEAAGCTYNKSAASDCYKAIRKHKRECNPPQNAFEACGRIYTCPGGQEYAEGITFEQYFDDYYEGFPYYPNCDEIDLDDTDPTVDEAYEPAGEVAQAE